MLEIQIILQNFLQTADVVSDYWWTKKWILMVGLNKDQ